MSAISRQDSMPFLLRSLLIATVILAGFHPASAQDQPAPADQAPAPPADTFFFQDGDKPAVFLGDSITEQARYTTLIETFVLSRYPDWKITFRNAGWSADTAGLKQRGGIEVGLPRDVIALSPKAVVINFGMNDARAGAAGLGAYLKSMSTLIEDLQKNGTRVVMVTTTPEERYEPNAPGGSIYNMMLKKYSDGLKIVADNEKVPLIDEFNPFLSLIEAGRQSGVLSAQGKDDDPTTVRLIPDGIHPNWGGHFIMASIILQGMHAPDMVSSVTIDAPSHSIIASNGCNVQCDDVGPGMVQFRRTDKALPWPVPGLSSDAQAQIDTAMQIPGFDPATTLNRYETKIIGLPDGAYDIVVDAVPIATYTAADLAKGVNLGFVRKGPIYDQEQQLLQAVIAKNNDYFNRWRNLQLYQAPNWLRGVVGVEDARKTEIARLDSNIGDAERSIESLRKPRMHIFRLVPTKVAPKVQVQLQH